MMMSVSIFVILLGLIMFGGGSDWAFQRGCHHYI